MRRDLGVIMVHWMMAVSLLGAATSGILLWRPWLQPHFAAVFEPENVGVIHIGLSLAVVVIFSLYLLYLKHKHFLDHIGLRRLRVNGRIRWGAVNVLLYWTLFVVIVLETISGILLTKLVDKDVLARVFGVQHSPLYYFHLLLVAPILAFPVTHVMIHWLDGGVRLIFSIFRPHVFPRKPSMTVILAKLREENAKLRKERMSYVSRR